MHQEPLWVGNTAMDTPTHRNFGFQQLNYTAQLSFPLNIELGYASKFVRAV